MNDLNKYSTALYLAENLTVYIGEGLATYQTLNPVADTFIMSLDNCDITVTKKNKAVKNTKCFILKNGDTFSWSTSGKYICILFEPGIIDFTHLKFNVETEIEAEIEGIVYSALAKNKGSINLAESIQTEVIRKCSFLNTSKDKRIQKVVNYISQHPEKIIENESLSSIAHLSKSRMIALFKETQKVNIKKYTLWIKIRYSLELLQKGKSIAYTCKTAGFFDQSHFSKTFKRTTGITPKKYSTSIKKIGKNIDNFDFKKAIKNIPDKKKIAA